jgi:hypothetical protein
VENPPNTRGKKPQAPASKNFTMIGVRLQTPTATAYKKSRESISNGISRSGLAFGFKRASASLRQKLAFILCTLNLDRHSTVSTIGSRLASFTLRSLKWLICSGLEARRYPKSMMFFFTQPRVNNEPHYELKCCGLFWIYIPYTLINPWGH